MGELSNDIATSKSARVIVPVCHIYLEHMLDLLLMKKFSHAKKFLRNTNNGFYEKVNKLKKLKILSDDEYHDLSLINNIRNKFVHNFKPDLKLISTKILRLRLHKFNKKRNPVEVILYDIIQLMSLLDQKLAN